MSSDSQDNTLRAAASEGTPSVVPPGELSLPKWPGELRPQATVKPRNPLRKRPWLWCAGGLCLALPALAIFWATRESTDIDTSHLPEWFQGAHRITSIPPPQAGKYFKNVGIFRPPSHSVAAELSPEWLEQNFTHYLGDDAFIWAKLTNTLPDGKLLNGCKVIRGMELEGVTLICAYAPECGAVNMFVHTAALRERSQGPPPPRQDDD